MAMKLQYIKEHAVEEFIKKDEGLDDSQTTI